MSDASSEHDEVPYYLMPVAAVFGTYALLSSIKMLHQLYKTFTYKPSKLTVPPEPLHKSKKFAFLLISTVVSILSYAYISAMVNNALATSSHAHFDPFDILAIDPSAASDSALVKSAYRTLSKTHHPDKPGGDAETFQKIHLAYKTLTDDVSRENYEKYGHPDGPVQTQTLNFALPDWLLHPTGSVAAVLIVLYLLLFVGLIYMIIQFVKKTEEKEAKHLMDNSVATSDMAYLANKLTPETTHEEILFYLATSPESLEVAEKVIDVADDLRRQREEFLNKSSKGTKKNKEEDAFASLDDSGWAEDDDDDEAASAKKAAQKAQEEKERLAKEVAHATGKVNLAENIKIEGLDEGVLGQQWVEQTLTDAGQWPPPFMKEKGLDKMMFSQKTPKVGKTVVDVLAHRGARRNLCMIMGRLNSTLLNTHPELVEAGKKTLIDASYFKTTIEFRQRMGLMLEAALRIAASTKCHRLFKTIVETASMFKIGTKSCDDEKTLAWFRESMITTYGGEGGIPKLELKDQIIETPDEEESQVGDAMALTVDVDRLHAENFSKQKIQMAMQQGIPPQVALNTYREGWWILVRAKKIDGDDTSESLSKKEEDLKNPVLETMDQSSKKLFEAETGENRLLTAWPFMIQNVAQKSGKVKVRFPAPDIPGSYKFYVDVKSQEFLGCDQSFTIDKEIKEKVEVETNDDSEGEGEEEEAKKTK